MSYKSSRYSSKVHFGVSDYEATLLEDSSGYRMSNSSYLKAREKMVKFILDKGRVLKMSLKTLHQCIFLMDCFCERMHTFPATVSGAADKHLLIAASTLLIGSKACELDERIPFIPKLRKYADLMCFSNEQFKEYEVAIGESLQWDLHRTTFYSFVELYLAYGILSGDDKISKTLVQSVQARLDEGIPGAEDGVRSLAKGEQSRPKISLNDMINPPADKVQYKSTSSPPSSGQFVRLDSLPDATIAELVKVFELYARDLCNLVVRDCTGYWVFPKPAIAMCIILYSRSAMMDPACVLSPRIQGVVGLGLDSISHPFGQIEEFIRLGSTPQASPTAFHKPTPMLSSRQQVRADLQVEIGGASSHSSNISTNLRPLQLASLNFNQISSIPSDVPSLMKTDRANDENGSKGKTAPDRKSVV